MYISSVPDVSPKSFDVSLKISLFPKERVMRDRPADADMEPPRWRELCSELQREKNPARFQALLEEINRLLREYEKRTSETKV